MQKKDILELKRRFKKDACTFTKLRGCYVDNQKNILLHIDETFLNLEEDEFYKYLADNLPESPWYYPEEQMSDMPLKLLAAEVVREKLFLFLQQEIPYALTVEPELWERREDGSVRAEMTIYVERDNQKIIILGKGGAMIKRIGQSARQELEKLLECRVHLFLFVKVRENWQEDAGRYSVWGLDFKA